MSPRQRSVSDEAILGATAVVVSRLGPARMTLADIGKEVGLSPATLLQRFGSKRGLLLKLAQLGAEMVAPCFAPLYHATSPIAALIAAATAITQHMRTPEQLANGLAFLQMDVSDPEFHAFALEHSRQIIAGYRTLLDAAVAKGELRPCDTARLARAVTALSGGSLIEWAIHRKGTAAAWVRQDIESLLDPYRAATTVPVAPAARRAPASATPKPARAAAVPRHPTSSSSPRAGRRRG